MQLESEWIEQDDVFLLRFGCLLGVEWIAMHDLGRSEEEARERVAWLRENRPELYAEHWVEGADGADTAD